MQTNLTVDRLDVTEGTVIDARPSSCCGGPLTARATSIVDYGAYRIEIGCCRTFGIATLPVGGVLTLTGTVAILC